MKNSAGMNGRSAWTKPVVLTARASAARLGEDSQIVDQQFPAANGTIS